MEGFLLQLLYNSLNEHLMQNFTLLSYLLPINLTIMLSYGNATQGLPNNKQNLLICL